MFTRRTAFTRGLLCLVLANLLGCQGGPPPSFKLDADLARSSLQTAMQAWVDGKKPADIKPVIIGDVDWENGKKLISFEILSKEETSDGSSLHIPVKLKFEGKGKGKATEAQTVYVVGTTPIVTIFPQN